jgi:hypothetical protein
VIGKQSGGQIKNTPSFSKVHGHNHKADVKSRAVKDGDHLFKLAFSKAFVASPACSLITKFKTGVT